MRVISSFCFKSISSLSHASLEMIIRNVLSIITGGHEAVYGIDACSSVNGVIATGEPIPSGALALFFKHHKLFVLSMEPGYGEWYLTRKTGFLILRCVDNPRRGWTRKRSFKNSRKCETSKIRFEQFQSYSKNALMDVCFDSLNGYAIGDAKSIFSGAFALDHRWQSPDLDCLSHLLAILGSNVELALQKGNLTLDEQAVNRLINNVCHAITGSGAFSQDSRVKACLRIGNDRAFKLAD